jgi:hypothetical protein
LEEIKIFVEETIDDYDQRFEVCSAKIVRLSGTAMAFPIDHQEPDMGLGGFA